MRGGAAPASNEHEVRFCVWLAAVKGGLIAALITPGKEPDLPSRGEPTQVLPTPGLGAAMSSPWANRGVRAPHIARSGALLGLPPDRGQNVVAHFGPVTGAGQQAPRGAQPAAREVPATGALQGDRVVPAMPREEVANSCASNVAVRDVLWGRLDLRVHAHERRVVTVALEPVVFGEQHVEPLALRFHVVGGGAPRKFFKNLFLMKGRKSMGIFDFYLLRAVQLSADSADRPLSRRFDQIQITNIHIS